MTLTTRALAFFFLLGACRPNGGVQPSGGSGGEHSSGDDSGVWDTAGGELPVEGLSASVHPEVHTILRVSWNQLEAVDSCHVEYRFDDPYASGDDWWSTPSAACPAGEQQAVLLGLPAEVEVEYRLVERVGGESWTSAVQAASTGELPIQLPQPELVSYDEELASPERYVLDTIDVGNSWYSGPFWVFILDRWGRYVWYREVPDSRCSLFAQVSSDGGYVLYEGTIYYTWGNLDPILVRETLSLDYSETEVVDDLGFSFDEIPGGLVLHDRWSTALVEEGPDGEREIWNCVPWMQDFGYSRREAEERCYPNSVVWVPATDHVLWSMYNSDSVVELDRQTGEVVRYFGQLEVSATGGEPEGEHWSFDPPESVVDYQHYPGYTADGHFLVSTHAVDEGSVQYAREWELDEASQTFREVWHFRSTDRYARYGGEAFRLDNGNTFIGYGTGGALREVTPEGEVAWELAWPADPNTHLTGHATLLTLEQLYELDRGPSR